MMTRRMDEECAQAECTTSRPAGFHGIGWGRVERAEGEFQWRQRRPHVGRPARRILSLVLFRYPQGGRSRDWASDRAEPGDFEQPLIILSCNTYVFVCLKVEGLKDEP